MSSVDAVRPTGSSCALWRKLLVTHLRSLCAASTGAHAKSFSPFAKGSPQLKSLSSCIKPYRDCIMMQSTLRHRSQITNRFGGTDTMRHVNWKASAREPRMSRRSLKRIERLGRATWPVGGDHDPGGVFSGRVLRETADIQGGSPVTCH